MTRRFLTRLPNGRFLPEEDDRPLQFPNQPCVNMPRSQTPALSKPPPSLDDLEYCLPNRSKPSASRQLYKFRGSIARPAYLIPPALHPASRRRIWSSLLPCGRALWVGWTSTHWLIIANFKEQRVLIPTPRIYSGRTHNYS